MKVLFFANRMPDLCGAFLHDIDLGIELQKRGHQVAFLVFKVPKEGVSGGTYRGFPYRHYSAGTQFLDESQIWICPHAPVLPDVRKLNARGYNRPLFATCHYDGNYRTITMNNGTGWSEMLGFINGIMEKNYRANIVPWPSNIVRTEHVRPIMHYDKIYIPEEFSPEHITLINANLNKGVRQFLEIARRMPNHKFLAVAPYYGELRVEDRGPSNLTWVPFDDDVRNILRQTRILLMPSQSESFGRVAVEAMVNGIPVLYTKPLVNPPKDVISTDGVAEWIGDAGIPVEREKIDDWVEQIKALDDPETYSARSLQVRAHIDTLNLFTEASRIAKLVEEFAAAHPVRIITPTQSGTPKSSAGVADVSRPREPGANARVGIFALPGRQRISRR